ncbi:hypothetical protein [Paraburkholderia sp. IW21]|uniref:hypothetical protein n=1 Tax=Paraburkholderia sp. IW21 TaxID=3242488 RepID=UPI00352159F7
MNHALNSIIPSPSGQNPDADAGLLTGTGSKANNWTSQSKTDLLMQGIANGLNAISWTGGMPPEANPGLVLVDSAAGSIAKAGVGAPGYVPSNAIFNSGNGERPSPRQSEKDVGSDLGSGHDPQISYKDGKQVSYGTSGSVRPDFVAADGAVSFEVKNYNIATNSSGLINNVAKQVVQRQANLPAGMEQQIVIDTRGQTVTPGQRSAIVQGIVQKSNGIINPIDIQFKTK